MSERTLEKCTRCGNEHKTMTIFFVRPGGHTWFVPSNSDFIPEPPQIERVCGNCLTDDEIMRELSPVVEFVLGVLIKNANPEADNDQTLVSLEIVRAFFMVRNNDADGTRNRGAAIRALGLGCELA